MANPMTHTVPQGPMQFLQQQRKVPNGSPKMAPNCKPKKSSMKKTASGTRTGDAVSDESEDGDDEGDSSASEDDDEPDDFALSGAQRIGNGAASRPAGLSSQDVDMFDGEQAVAGADESDEDYGAVDEISDGDESIDGDEKNVLRSAEDDLRAEFERTEKPRNENAVTSEINDLSLADDEALARRLSLQSEEGTQDDIGLDLDFNEDPFRGLQANSSLYQEMVDDAEGFLGDDLALWRQTDFESRESSAPSSVTQKRVRFDETHSSRTSSMSSDEDPRDSYPDLFDERDDPWQNHSMLLNDTSNEAIVDNESIYDFEDEYERAAFEIDEQGSESNSDMSDFSSDEDEGDTTDEDDEDVVVARVKAIKNANAASNTTPASTPNSAPSTPVPSKRSTPSLARANTANARLATPKSANGLPPRGTFARDPTKASVSTIPMGTGVKVTCPTNPPEHERAYWERVRKAQNSRPVSPNGSLSHVRGTPRAAAIPQRPFTAKSTLGTMFDGNLDFLRSNDENGITEELLRPTRSGSMQSSSFASTMSTDDHVDQVQSNIKLSDFVQLDDSDSEMDEPPSDSAIMSPTGTEFSFDNALQSSNNNLLGHFDQNRGLVSAFRHNQNFARHASSMAANPAKRAQTSEANALQKGRRAAANTPMTPARKNRASQDVTNAGVKKTASPLVQKQHRRSRGSSLSGIQQTLALDRFANGSN